jgi:hypothetical protein
MKRNLLSIIVTATQARPWMSLQMQGVTKVYDSLSDGVVPSFSLPRSGKDITVTLWMTDGSKKLQKLKWNGNGFGK